MPGPLGFACHWFADHRATWSGTPWSLRSALAEQVCVADVGYELSRAQQVLLKAAHLRLAGGRPVVTGWRHSARARAIGAGIIERGIAEHHAPFVLQIADLAVTSVPFGVVQDLSYAMLLELWGDRGVLHFPGLSRAELEALNARQLQLYQRADALFPMSQWLAASMVSSGVDPAKIHVVPPGATSISGDVQVVDRLDRRRRRLLFLGRDFTTKGGPQLLAALGELRREYADLTLTIAGPASWPVAGPVPAGVEFLGAVPRSSVGQLFADHDLFVMPSHLEGFGIVFAEALGYGLPCVGRRACAMPEIIEEGVTGGLVVTEDPGELAAVISRVLNDDGIYRTCQGRAAQVRAYYSWDRAARDILTACTSLGLDFQPPCNPTADGFAQTDPGGRQ